MDTNSGFTDIEIHRMVVDLSSLIWTNLLGGKDAEFGREVEHNGRKVQVNSGQYGYDKAIEFVIRCSEKFQIAPHDIILVVEGVNSKIHRKMIYDGYKEGDKRAPEQYEEFRKCRQMLIDALVQVGASTVTQDNVEGDDMIAYLCQKLKGPVTVLTNDGDLAILINDRVSIYRMGELLTDNPYGPWPSEFILLYKALVGDTSDKLPGAKGFGEKAFTDLYSIYGDDGLRAFQGLIETNKLDDLAEDVADLAALQKVIDAKDLVTKCYKCALLYPERVNTLRQPIQWQVGKVAHHSQIKDERLKHLGAA